MLRSVEGHRLHTVKVKLFRFSHGDLRSHFPETYWDLQNEEQVSSFQCMWRHQTAAWPGLITDANAA